jgi:hypothetical protein
MRAYPYPLRDWRDPEQYPQGKDLDARGWAWEFLRRNPEYQRLWDLFDSLPDYLPCDDGSGFSTNKIGKWRGAPPLGGFRFFEDGAGWYADPEPIPSEHENEYYDRCPDGEVLPFADYLMRRFKLIPAPLSPLEDLREYHVFSDAWGDDSLPPWEYEIGRPAPELHEHIHEWGEQLDALASDHTKVAILFDLRYPIEEQVRLAGDMLSERKESLKADPVWPLGPTIRKPKIQANEFRRYVRLLDAIAAGAPTEEIAAALYPHTPNGYPDRAGNRRVSKDRRKAETIRDVQYWRL